MCLQRKLWHSFMVLPSGYDTRSDEKQLISPTLNGAIPDGAIWHREILRRVTPPARFSSVVGWMQAATLSKNQQGEMARIVVDYMKLIEKNANGSERIVYEEDYNISSPRPLACEPTYCEGGLYSRSPRWFYTDDHAPIYNSEIRGGLLIVDASVTPDNILHWWTTRVDCRANSRYFLEARVKIEGKVGLQLGSDYWVDKYSPWNGYDQHCEGVNNCEAWISDWFGDTDGQFITIKAPRN